jgi:hypothetical protein
LQYPFQSTAPGACAEADLKLVLVLNLDLVSQSRERIPTRIRRCLFAGACCEVLVLTAARAEALAVWLAEGSGGQGQQHLLAHDILKQKTALLIIPDFGLIGGDCVLSRLGISLDRPEDQVKITQKRLRNWFDAPGAENLELTVVASPQPNVVHLGIAATLFTAVFNQQVSLPFHG